MRPASPAASVCEPGPEMITGKVPHQQFSRTMGQIVIYRHSIGPDSRSGAHCATIAGDWEEPSGELRFSQLRKSTTSGSPPGLQSEQICAEVGIDEGSGDLVVVDHHAGAPLKIGTTIILRIQFTTFQLTEALAPMTLSREA